MNIQDIFSISGNSLRERKFRFALNLIGILIGCAAVMGLVSITQGLRNNVSEQLEVFGPQNVIVIPGDVDRGPGPVSVGSLGWRDLEIIKKLPEVERATPIVAGKMAQFEVKGERYFAEVYGITHEYDDINKNTELADGRAFLRTDSAAAIIGSNIAKPPNKEEAILEVGDRLNIEVKVGDEIKTMTLRIIGVLKPTGGSFGADLDGSINIPLRTVQQLFEVGGEFDFIMAQAESVETVSETVEAIENKLGDSVSVVSYESAQEMVGEVIGTIEAVLGGIAAISLVVAGVGIINTMMVSVMERTREIGTMKAIGAKSREVLMIFISEAMLTGLIGGVMGVIFGIFLSQVIGNFINLQASSSLGLSLLVVGFAILTSVISGIYPAWRAAKLSPVEALRYG
jgi:putative ABC transport system permease protein